MLTAVAQQEPTILESGLRMATLINGNDSTAELWYPPRLKANGQARESIRSLV